MNEFGDRLKKLRISHSENQTELAEKLDVSNVQLNRYETGARKPDFEFVIRTAEFFNVTTDYLLGHVDEKNNKEQMYLYSGMESLTEDEKEHIQEELERYREMKKKWEKMRDLYEDDE